MSVNAFSPTVKLCWVALAANVSRKYAFRSIHSLSSLMLTDGHFGSRKNGRHVDRAGVRSVGGRCGQGSLYGGFIPTSRTAVLGRFLTLNDGGPDWLITIHMNLKASGRAFR